MQTGSSLSYTKNRDKRVPVFRLSAAMESLLQLLALALLGGLVLLANLLHIRRGELSVLAVALGGRLVLLTDAVDVGASRRFLRHVNHLRS